MESAPRVWYDWRMQGVMSPPKRFPSRPLMLAAGAPLHPPRGLMSAEGASFAGFDVQLELRRLLWTAAAVLAAVLYLLRAAR
jgi:hypothetical protein